MRRSLVKAALISFSAMLVSTGTAAQAKEDAALAANKKLVLDFFRVVFEAENVDAAKDYLKDDYIQHNPKVPTGRDGFVKYFKAKMESSKAGKA